MRLQGLSTIESTQYLALNRRCNFESMTRKWRKEHPEETDQETAEEYRREFSPNPCAKIMSEHDKLVGIAKQYNNSPDSLF